MRIAIVGCGAMGTVLGAYLTQGGYDIDMVDTYREHVEALNSKGAHIIGSVDTTIPVKALDPNDMIGEYDLIFLLTKQTANDAILPLLSRHLAADGTICTLQNGAPEPFVAKYIGAQRTVGGAVLWGATFMEPGVSELTQDITKSGYLFEIGEIDGSISERIQQVAQVLGAMGPAKVSDQLMSSRWTKLVYNACMSGMSAVCGCTFGEILDTPAAKACLSYIGREVKICSEAVGHPISNELGNQSTDVLYLNDRAQFDASQDMFLSLYDGLRPAKASMLQDLEKNKLTEVDMINGYVCETGDQFGIDTPFNDKVVEIVHKVEQGVLKAEMDNLKLFDPALCIYN